MRKSESFSRSDGDSLAVSISWVSPRHLRTASFSPTTSWRIWYDWMSSPWFLDNVCEERGDSEITADPAERIANVGIRPKADSFQPRFPSAR